MIQDQYSNTLTRVEDTRSAPGLPARSLPLQRGLRHLSFGLAFTLLVSCLEGVVWLAVPGSQSGAHTLATFLALPVHTPLLWLVPAIEIVLGTWLAWTLAGPLALLAYLKAVFHAQEVYRARSTPLQSWSYPYDVPLLYTLDNPDPTRSGQTRVLTPLELIETLASSVSASRHLLLLGEAGAGKTMFLHEYLSSLAQRRRQLVFSRRAIPLYLPLQAYALLLQESAVPAEADFSLLAFFEAGDSPALECLRPYLKRLWRQGRLLFLCDGLDEVPPVYRSGLDRELIALFRQTRNGLFLTCTPDLYKQSEVLTRAVSENLVPRAVFQPLEASHVRSVVERFITELDASYRPNLPTAGQVMSVLDRTRLHMICTTPFYLFALLGYVDTLPISEIKHLDTRGRLLRTFLHMRLETVAQSNAETADDLLFLRELSCVARGRGDSDLLSLPIEVWQALSGSERHVGHERALQQVLANWAREQQVYSPFAEETISSLAETLPLAGAEAIMQRVYRAGLIDIDQRGVLSFRHTLVVTALLAEYLSGLLGNVALRMDEVETLPVDLTLWSEPLALWAGSLAEPLEAAEEFARYACERPDQRLRALVASLICLGVAQTPPGAEIPQPLQVPPAFDLAFSDLLNERSALEDLARLFIACATRRTPELYHALFPLLLIEGSEAFLRLLDPVLIAELFFQRLIETIDDAQQDVLVKRLVRALSGWGAAVVPRASWLCSARSGTAGRLRTAAINILGGTQTEDAVEPLMTCLRDPETYIVKRAANALVRLGADLTLPRLLQELNTRGSSGAKQPLHEMLFPIFARFLNETNPVRQLRPEQFEQINEALLELLRTHTNQADLEQARELLVSQGRLAEERDSGRIAIRMLVQNLATTDDKVARSMTGALKEVGSVATPSLLEQLEDQSSPAERVRILEVLASVRDERALPALLRLLADPSPAVQQTLAATLAVYAPACIGGLIDAILHHSDEVIADRAEQVLGDLGLVVVDPVVRALKPLVEGRTVLLVHVLERVGDKRVVPALIALLRTAQADVTVALGIIQALGQFADERAVRPLMTVLAGDNPLLYEGAINALSNLGTLACSELLIGLDTPEKTPLVMRIERALLGMQPFPGPLLLSVVDEGSEEQIGYVEEIFQARGSDAAQVLASNLFHPQPRICAWIRRLMGKMDGRYAVPALLELLARPERAWREQLAGYLLMFPQEAIPPLVGLLDDPERGEAAVMILQRAGQPALAALVPALDVSQGIVQTRAKALLVSIVQNQPELIGNVVQLFGLALPVHARAVLERLLTEDLADLSLPALLPGLEDAHLVGAVSATLVRLARRSAAWCATVLEALLLELRVAERRHGAMVTLVDLGSEAVAGVGALMTDADEQVARAARQILGEIGTPAFPLLWAAYSDASHPARREAALDVFRAMPTQVIKDELVELLTSARREDISMALALLLERIHDEAQQPGRAGEMLPALLEHVQVSSDELASLRILSLLLLLGGNVVAQPLIEALYANPQGHERLTQAFLLLGQGVEDHLLTIVQNQSAPPQLRAEAAGILAMRVANQDVQELALNLSKYGLWPGHSLHNATAVLNTSQLEISLRALGGLLVSGHWSTTELQNMRAASKAGSPQREIFDILLGWRYTPELTRLQQEVETERQERNQELMAYTQELLILKRQTIDLEHDLEMLRKEHEEQHYGHEQKSKELQDVIADLNKEKQTFISNSQGLAREKERFQAEAQHWQNYSQQLEKELNALRRSASGS